MTDLLQRIEAAKEPRQSLTCRDFDEDCDEITDKVHCYLYDPAKGMCPFLRAERKDDHGAL